MKTWADQSCILAALKEISPSKSASVMLAVKSPFPLLFITQKNDEY